MKHFFFFALLFPAVLTCTKAQTVSDSAYYRANPVWISMMNEQGVNYFEAVRAFEIFWMDKERPEETDEAFEKVEKNETETEPTNLTGDALIYAADYRKFIYWKHTVLPFVKPDGALMTASERIEKHQQRK